MEAIVKCIWIEKKNVILFLKFKKKKNQKGTVASALRGLNLKMMHS
jgi:hypothetical protein